MTEIKIGRVVGALPGWIVDVWLMDIADVLKRHGYVMKIFKEDGKAET